MVTFEVGDVVTGPSVDSEIYVITTSEAEMEVEEVSEEGDTILVKIIKHLRKSYVGKSFWVESEYFKLIHREDGFEGNI